jgi:hypothetical protein
LSDWLYQFSVVEATFRPRGASAEDGVPRWDFEVRTGPPLELPTHEEDDDVLDFSDGVRLYSEQDPVPLVDQDDLTGTELKLKEPFHPELNEPYFTFYTYEHDDVSDVTLRFLERREDEYRIEFTGLAHHIQENPAQLRVETWIKRLPPRASS